MSKILLTARGLKKSYPQGASSLEILKGVDFLVHQGEAIGIVGPSGSGKSTFLQIIASLDSPQEGELFFEDDNLLAMDDENLALFRNQKMGFVFQFHHLINELTAIENIILPCRIAKEDLAIATERAQLLLNDLGLKDRGHHYPTELSGGELQRVAIARALIRSPQILFADEPTGNLDSQNSLIIQDLFFSLKEKYQLTLVVVTHDINFALRFDRFFRMKDGRFEHSV